MKTYFLPFILLAISISCVAQTDLCYWIEPDATYIHPNVADWIGSPGNTSENYSAPISLPFEIDFFGQTFTEVTLTTKGTIVMGDTGYLDFSPSAFPNPLPGETTQQYDHVCGYWSDFDFGAGGDLYYKVTEEALYVNYVEVGRWPNDASRTNTFQMIIAANGNSVIGNGNNVQFYYKDMQWANSQMNFAENGFNAGANLAIVGADRVSGPEHFAFGRFNLPTDDYNGPYGISSNEQDGLYWLNGKVIEFNTSSSGSNSPPAVVADFCQEITLCNQSDALHLVFTSSEVGQNVSVTLSGLPDGVEFSTNNLPSAVEVEISIDFDLVIPGSYDIDVIATDDGFPSQQFHDQFLLNISPVSYSLEISGNSVLCSGSSVELTATPGLDYYQWNNGDTTQTTSYSPGGTASLFAIIDGCYLQASFDLNIPIDVFPDIILGNLPISTCPGQETEICGNDVFVSYNWFIFPNYSGQFIEGTPLDEPCVHVGGIDGSYALQVIDEHGCEGMETIVVEVTDVIILDETSNAICSPDNSIAFTGSFIQENNPLIFYALSTNANGWEDAYVQISVIHNDESADTAIFSSLSSFEMYTDVITTAGDSIIIEYFANGNNTADNSLWFVNCNESTPIFFNAPLEEGILWSGMSTCTFSALSGEWTVEGPDGWTMNETGVFDMTFFPSEFAEYTLCFTPNICNTSYCYDVIVEDSLQIELQLPETVLLCAGDTVNIIPTTNSSSVILWEGIGLQVAIDELSATAGPYSGDGEQLIVVSQSNSCGMFSDSLNILFLNDLEAVVNDDTISCDEELILDPFPGIQNDPYITCSWTNTSTGESFVSQIYTVTTTGTYTVQFSSECITTTPIEFTVTNEFLPPQSVPILGDTIFCDNEGLADFTTPLLIAQYDWSLEPPIAGSIINEDQNQLTLDFTDGYAGNATISVVLTNSCGSSDPAELEVMIDDCSDVVEAEIGAFRIYPNPARDFVFVDDRDGVKIMRLYDQLGRQIWSGTNNTIDIKPWPAGIYFLSIEGTFGKSIHRIEILR